MKKDITIKSGIKELGIYEKNADAWVSSRILSEIFDKRHADVLRGIEDILSLKEDDFTERNFALSEYKDKSGKKNKEYLLNRKGFTLVAMGFTGEKAIEFKKQYIEAFENMHSLIQTRLLSKDGYKKMTDAIKKYLDGYTDDKYVYSTEANMINKIILGMSAKQFKELNGIDQEGNTRDNIVQSKLDELNEAQILNAQLIKSGWSIKQREETIREVFDK